MDDISSNRTHPKPPRGLTSCLEDSILDPDDDTSDLAPHSIRTTMADMPHSDSSISRDTSASSSSICHLSRIAIETALELVGLIVFENPIKRESGHVIAALEKAALDVRMITGDSVQTAMHGKATAIYVCNPGGSQGYQYGDRNRKPLIDIYLSTYLSIEIDISIDRYR